MFFVFAHNTINAVMAQKKEKHFLQNPGSSKNFQVLSEDTPQPQMIKESNRNT